MSFVPVAPDADRGLLRARQQTYPDGRATVLSKKGGALQRAQVWKLLNPAQDVWLLGVPVRRGCETDSKPVQPLDTKHHLGVYWDHARRIGQRVSALEL